MSSFNENLESNKILKKLINRSELTREEAKKLPEKYRQLYFLDQDVIAESPSIIRRFKKRDLYAKRKSKREEEFSIYERTLRKKYARQQLSSMEKDIYDKFNQEYYGKSARKIEMNAIDVLDDVVKGNYNIEDVNLARNGTDLKPIENSPIQLLENVVEDVKQHTQNLLQTSDSLQFFQTIESNVLERITPMQLDNIVSSCTVGIDMMQGNQFDENEAREACESYIKALAMQEGETKVLNAIDEVNMKKMKTIEKLAEAGAVAASTMLEEESLQMPSTSAEKKINPEDLGFNITSSNFDVSFEKSEDQDAYKPLEIISYIGMTE